MMNEMWSYDTYSAGWSSRQVRDFRHIFMKLVDLDKKYPSKYTKCPSSGSRIVPCGRMTKQLSFFANTANAPAKTEFLHKTNFPPANIRSGNLLTGLL
jgi:hypothetical protein